MAEEGNHEGVSDVDATVDDVDCSGSFVGLQLKRELNGQRERERERFGFLIQQSIQCHKVLTYGLVLTWVGIWFFNLVENTIEREFESFFFFFFFFCVNRELQSLKLKK